LIEEEVGMSDHEVLSKVRQRLTLARFERWVRQQALSGRRVIGQSCSGWTCPLSRFLSEEVGQSVYVGRTRVFLSEPVEEAEEQGEGVEDGEWELSEMGVELPEWAVRFVAWVDRLAGGEPLRLADVQMIVGEVKRELEARRW
jgi:hypothetical protein